MSELNTGKEEKPIVTSDSSGKVHHGLIEAILDNMKSEFNKAEISEIYKKEKITLKTAPTDDSTDVKSESKTISVTESSHKGTEISDVGDTIESSEKTTNELATSASSEEKILEVSGKSCEKKVNSDDQISTGEDTSVICLNVKKEVDNQQTLKKVKLNSERNDTEKQLKDIKMEEPCQDVSSTVKRSLRSQKLVQETSEPTGVKRSARRRSKDSPRESVLQSAIARKEKSFSNLSHNEDKSSASRVSKASTHRSPRLSPVEKSQTGKINRSATEKGKLIHLPKSPRLQAVHSSSKIDHQDLDSSGKLIRKKKHPSDVNTDLVSDSSKESNSKVTLKSQVSPNSMPTYTKTGKRRYKPFKGLRYSFTSGSAKRTKIVRRQGRERNWSESAKPLNISRERKIVTRNSVLQKDSDNCGVKSENVLPERDVSVVSATNHRDKDGGGGAGRSESPVVADACQTAVHKRKLQPCVEEELEGDYVKRSRHNHMPSPSPAEDSQGPSIPESTAISSGAGTAALCCCQSKSQLYATGRLQGGGDLYCQAVDSFDNRTIGCCNIISPGSFRMNRPSVKVPYMILCEVHINRLLRHNCCPGCGLFCTQGRFVQCTSLHIYHRDCQLIVKDKTVCPHCGLDSPETESILTLGSHKNPVFLPQQKPPKKYPSAKMSLQGTVVPKKENCNEMDEDPFPSITLTLPNGKLLSPDGLANPLDKEKLSRLLNIVSGIKEPATITDGTGVQARYSPKTLYHASKSGNIDKLLSALASGVNPNHQFRDSAIGTALHAASTGSHLSIVHVLLQAGAQIDMMNRDQHTALMLAAMAGHNSVVKYLIKAGACVTLKGPDGMTALHLAAKAGNLEACYYLLSTPNVKVTYINMLDDGGWTPLVWAAEHRHTHVARFLLGKKADPLIRDVEQNIALHWSAFSGSVDITEMLMNYGCDVNSTNTHGDTPLHIGARQNMYSCVQLLLARGADVTLCNKSGDTPQNCCISVNSECFKVLTLNFELVTVMRKQNKKSMKLLCNDISRGKENNPIQCVNNIDDESEPRDYIYISENCFTSNISVNRTITSLQACQCDDSCSNTNCLCGNISLNNWYDDDGRLVPDFNYSDPPMIFECNQACSCNVITCNNRVVQNGLTARFQLFRTRSKGWGVRTLRPILKGTYVCEYIGEIISDCEADHREDDSYLFDLDNKDGETYCIDARHYGNVARFINHMCVPNLQPVRIFIDHQDLHFPRIAFFANRDIAAEEELGFDYGEKFWIIKCKSFTCTCGATNCRYSEFTIRQTLENYNLRLQEEVN